ncbi:MAG: hypothetical protein JST84_08360 [Acidobacteria bacterium]|nr:hypothetical protein [Acidobacteriota bacterium]
MARARKSEYVDAGRMESEIYEPDAEIKDEFIEASRLGSQREFLERGLLQPREYASPTAGGDMDMPPEESAVGEESAAGGNALPDQDEVEEIGRAMGLTYEDNEPLDMEGKLGRRDKNRWELNPVSSEDYQDRA